MKSAMVLWTVGGRRQIRAKQMSHVEQARVLADKVKEAVRGSLWRKRTKQGFPDIREASFGLSHFVICLAIVLALEQVSVIKDLKRTKECRKKALLSGKKSNNSKNNISLVKTPSSVSIAKISLKCSSTRSTGT